MITRVIEFPFSGIFRVSCNDLRFFLENSFNLEASSFSSSGELDSYEVRKSVELGFLLLLFAIGNCTLARAASSRGTLVVTARVQTSAMWVQDSNGKWTLVVANAADPASTFVGRPNGKKSHTAEARPKAAPVMNAVTKVEKPVSQGGS